MRIFLVLFLQFRQNIDEDDNKLVTKREILGQDLGPELGGRSAMTSREIKSFCSAHLISRQRQRNLEDSGDLDNEMCLMCLDAPSARAMWLELPCKHRYHAACLRESLEHDVTRCRIATCNFDVRDTSLDLLP